MLKPEIVSIDKQVGEIDWCSLFTETALCLKIREIVLYLLATPAAAACGFHFHRGSC